MATRKIALTTIALHVGTYIWEQSRVVGSELEACDIKCVNVEADQNIIINDETIPTLFPMVTVTTSSWEGGREAQLGQKTVRGVTIYRISFTRELCETEDQGLTLISCLCSLADLFLQNLEDIDYNYLPNWTPQMAEATGIGIFDCETFTVEPLDQIEGRDGTALEHGYIDILVDMDVCSI